MQAFKDSYCSVFYILKFCRNSHQGSGVAVPFCDIPRIVSGQVPHLSPVPFPVASVVQSLGPVSNIRSAMGGLVVTGLLELSQSWSSSSSSSSRLSSSSTTMSSSTNFKNQSTSQAGVGGRTRAWKQSDPTVLSLGHSRRMWSALSGAVPQRRHALFGALPHRKFCRRRKTCPVSQRTA